MGPAAGRPPPATDPVREPAALPSSPLPGGDGSARAADPTGGGVTTGGRGSSPPQRRRERTGCGSGGWAADDWWSRLLPSPAVTGAHGRRIRPAGG
ncbi:Os09g0289200 [Oryza sativa Japonica Group]|uniref:Os09g0289200 protein n=1 Tax=Oryza sativa subsp. japonica TaxID=39947 RepID=A0A0N7KQI1_ORYSJ|nr:Os09g0289200 [Oryza sativa Japonica Group]